jgi:hypothetical protein
MTGKEKKKRKEICYKSSLNRLHVNPTMGRQGELAALQPRKHGSGLEALQP